MEISKRRCGVKVIAISDIIFDSIFVTIGTLLAISMFFLLAERNSVNSIVNLGTVALFASFATVIICVHVWTAVNLYRATDVRKKPSEAMRQARTWANLTLLTFIVNLIFAYTYKFPLYLWSSMITYRVICYYNVSYFIKELDDIRKTQRQDVSNSAAVVVMDPETQADNI